MEGAPSGEDVLLVVLQLVEGGHPPPRGGEDVLDAAEQRLRRLLRGEVGGQLLQRGEVPGADGDGKPRGVGGAILVEVHLFGAPAGGVFESS